MKNRMRAVFLTAIIAVSAALSACGSASNNASGAAEPLASRETLNFNTGWLYSPEDYENGENKNLDESGFESVSLPHANRLLDKHKGPGFDEQIQSYRFVSWYRRHFTLGKEYSGKRVEVEFEGVATVADVYVNGEFVGEHKGAYTGFAFDITDFLKNGDNVIAVRVDSQRQPEVPPEGGDVDYCVFGGIVRDVKMVITSPAYISDTFVTTPGLSGNEGRVNAAVTVKNGYKEKKSFTVDVSVADAEGKEIANISEEAEIQAGEEAEITLISANLSSLHLWSVDDPYLYTAKTTLSSDGAIIDETSARFGFREYSFEDDGLYLNGEKIEMVGVNRHEQWAWIGRAVPDKLQRADADLIKDTGFNAVRCSHYPQDPSFLERCDEIGLIVFEEAPGWAYIGGDSWKEVYKENIREMILRDRNHPSILSWGTRVNESADNDELYTETNRIAKELDPTRPTHGVRHAQYYDNSNFLDGEDIYTANYTYPDVPRFSPYIVAEHSDDWFFGHGLAWASDNDALSFAKSFAERVNYYFGNDLCLGGFAWSMFDYNNEVNYTHTDNLFYSGLYDIFRIPKPASYFYRSQKDPEKDPTVYIANYCTESSPRTVTVFSNCDEVELYADGVSVGKAKPSLYTNLPHPMFEFRSVNFKESLEAVGYLNGNEAARFKVTVPKEPVKLVLKPQYDTLTADGSDFTSVEIYAVDENGQTVISADNEVKITLTGCGRFIGEETIALEGGHAAFIVQSVFNETGSAVATVTSGGLEQAKCEIKITEFTEKTVPLSEGRQTVKPKLMPKSINDNIAGSGMNQFNYAGRGWQSCPEAGCYSGDNHYSSSANDTVTVEFTGTGIIWYGSTAPNHGIMTVSIDGKKEKVIDCYSAERVDNTVLFKAKNLRYGTHTLTMTVTGDKNEDSSGRYINVDRVEIIGG